MRKEVLLKKIKDNKRLDNWKVVANLVEEHIEGTLSGHYSKKSIDPIDYILSHGFDFPLGSVIKYITRYWDYTKNTEDLIKAIDYLQIELKKVLDYDVANSKKDI